MPAMTKTVKYMLIMLLCCVFSLGMVALISARHISDAQKVSAENATILLCDDSVLTAQFNSISPNFSTIGAGPYDPLTNPYKIASPSDLIRLAYYVNVAHSVEYASASYQMTSHIDLSNFNWSPIGGLGSPKDENAIPFCGVFDGNGYSIYGLTINQYYSIDNNGVDVVVNTQKTQQDEILVNTTAGLFGAVSYYEYIDYEEMTISEFRPVIKLLGLAHTQINTNAYYVGSVVGYLCGDNNSSTTINISYTTVADAVASTVVQECYNAGYVHGGMYVGGIAGMITKGAVVYNCSNAEDANNDWQEVEYGEELSLGKIGVYGMDADSNVGGIAGGLVEINSSNVIGNSVNSASVAKYGICTNVGGVVGYSTANKDNYRSNTYCNSTVYSVVASSDMLGVGRALTGTNAMTKEIAYRGRISIKNMPSGSYLPYNRGSTPDTIWHIGASINNSMPYLTRVSPLVKVQLNVEQLDEQTPGLINFYGYDANGQETSGTEWYKPIIISGNTFYIEIGKSVCINTSSLDDAYYQFKQWKATTFSTDAVTSNTVVLDDTYTQPVMFVSTACVFTAVYDYVYYAISTYSNDARFGSVLAQNSLNNDLSTVDWPNITQTTDSVVYARMGDYVRLIARPNGGYALDDVSSSLSTVYSIVDNAIVVQVAGAENILFNFVAKGYNISTNIPQTVGGADLANVVFNINGGANVSGVTDQTCYGAVVNITIDNIAQNYYFSHYLISADNMQDLQLDEGVSSFVVEDYDNYVITPVLYKQSYLVKLMGNSDRYTLQFLNPDVNVVQTYVEFDGSFSVKIDNIAAGYSFVEWQCNYLGDSSEAWVLDNVILSKTGLTGNVELTPIIAINKYDVAFVAGSNGVVSYAGANQVDYGTVVQSVATANVGYKFVGWTDEFNNVLSVQPTISYVVVGNYSATANFELATFRVVFGGYSDDNAVFGTNSVEQTNKDGVYEYGADVEFNVVCPSGYAFERWEILSNSTGLNYTLNDDGSGAIENIQNDVYIMAYFVARRHTVSFGINNLTYGDFKFNYNGWTKFSDIQDGSNYVYQDGQLLSVVSLDAEFAPYPNIAKNYAFSYWMVNNLPYNSGSVLNILVSEDVNIQAYYRPKEYSVVVKKTIMDGGAVSGLNNEYYAYGSSITLDVIVNSGYIFDGWYVYDIVSRTNKLLSTNLNVSLMVDGDKSLICSISKLGSIIIDVNDISAGAVSGAGNYKVGTVVTLVASPKEGYSFVGWQQGNQIVATTQSLVVNVGEQTKLLQAVFSPLFKVDVNLNNQKYGNVIIDRQNGNSGDVKLTAVANDNYSFVGWQYDGQIISTDAEYTLKLSGDLMLEAVFVRSFDFNIIIIIGGCIIFAVLLIIILAHYIKAKEAEPLKTRFILESANEEDYLLTQRRKTKRSQISGVPVRKITIDEIEPVPVRKSYTPVQEYKHKDKEDKKQG